MQSPLRHRMSLHRPIVTRALPVTALVAALLAVSACGAGESAKTTTSSAAAVGSPSADLAAFKADLAEHAKPFTDYPKIAPLTGDPGSLKGKTVWYIPFAAVVPFLSAVGDSVTAALGTLGATVKVCDGKLQPTEVASCLGQASQQKADAVITGYIPYQLLPSAFDGLVAKGIPVLLAGATESGGKKSSATLGFYDDGPTQQVTQRLLAESIIVRAGGKAKVAYIRVTDNPQLIAAADYGQKFYTDSCPGCSVTPIEFSTATQSKLASSVSAALVANPDITDVALMLDGAGAGGIVASGIQNAGKASSVHFASGGSGLDSFQRVAGGTQTMLAAFSPTYTGWQFADGIVRMLTGSAPVVTAGPVRVFDKDTAAALKLSPDLFSSIDWYGSDAYKATFTSAWKIG